MKRLPILLPAIFSMAFTLLAQNSTLLKMYHPKDGRTEVDAVYAFERKQCVVPQWQV